MCLLERCMVRHTKRQVLGGQQVLQLPPKVEEDVPGETACLHACMHACDSAALAHSRAFLAAAHAICARAPPLPHPRAVVLSASEAAVYMEAHTRCAAVFARYMRFGAAGVSRYLLQIMALLMPLRRICSGGMLRPQVRRCHFSLPLILPRARQPDAVPPTCCPVGGPGSSTPLICRQPPLASPRSPAFVRPPPHSQDLLFTDPHHGDGTNLPPLPRLGVDGTALAVPAAMPTLRLDSTLVVPEDECAICMDCMEAPAATPCGHWFCK
jgi:hypothetical protein